MEFEKHSFNVYWPKVRIYWREWLPTKGNVIFTLLVSGSLFWAQRVGAISLNVPAAANTSAGTIAYQGRLANTGCAPLTGTKAQRHIGDDRRPRFRHVFGQPSPKRGHDGCVLADHPR